MSPNNGTLFNRKLRPKFLNNLFGSSSLTNFDFLLPHAAHFDCRTILLFSVSEIFEFKFSIFFCTLHNKSTCFYIISKF